jgi:hypothetical protein
MWLLAFLNLEDGRREVRHELCVEQCKETHANLFVVLYKFIFTCSVKDTVNLCRVKVPLWAARKQISIPEITWYGLTLCNLAVAQCKIRLLSPLVYFYMRLILHCLDNVKHQM